VDSTVRDLISPWHRQPDREVSRTPTQLKDSTQMIRAYFNSEAEAKREAAILTGLGWNVIAVTVWTSRGITQAVVTARPR
jgi:hypothetical protein